MIFSLSLRPIDRVRLFSVFLIGYKLSETGENQQQPVDKTPKNIGQQVVDTTPEKIQQELNDTRL